MSRQQTRQKRPWCIPMAQAQSAGAPFGDAKSEWRAAVAQACVLDRRPLVNARGYQNCAPPARPRLKDIGKSREAVWRAT